LHEALWYEPAYQWLASKVSFYPLFLAAGESRTAHQLTGYSNQFHRRQPDQPLRNEVLFSFSDLPEPISFQDYSYWHLPLGAGYDSCWPHQPEDVQVSASDERSILKRSWRRSDWLRWERREPGSVQAVVPELDLTQATRVWCRNQPTRQRLLRMGFSPERVSVQRIPVITW